jgi:hypothetical protein
MTLCKLVLSDESDQAGSFYTDVRSVVICKSRGGVSRLTVTRFDPLHSVKCSNFGQKQRKY